MEEAKDHVKQVQNISCVSVKSLKCPYVPARLCHRKSSNHLCTCKTCEVTISYKEQCVHSIVANDMMYIKEQFDFRHYLRDYISSEYTANNGTNYNGDTEPTNEKIKNHQNNMDDGDNESLIFDDTSESDDESEIVFDDNIEEDEIDYEADNYCTSNQKQALYYERQYKQRSQIKPLNATDLKKIFNAILSNYDTCTNQMKLVVNSIVLSLNEITQTMDRQVVSFVM